MLIEALSMPFRKARLTNTTDASFPTRLPTNTEPTGVGDNAAQTTSSVIELQKGGLVVRAGIYVVPYGTGSDTNTFNIRVIGWRSVGENNPHTMLWIPIVLAEVQATLSSTNVGIAGMTIVATEIFAKALALVGTTGNANVSMEMVSPNVAGILAHFTVSCKGFQKIELTFATGSSATDCNALIAFS